MWGLTSDGRINVNLLSSSSSVISINSPFALTSNTWTHIVQTYSSTNVLKLYIDGQLVANTTAPNGHSVGPYIFLGSTPSTNNTCQFGTIATGQFYGSIDEFRVFGKELISADICSLANP